MGNEIKEHFGAREAGKDTGVEHSNINRCCNGKYKSAGGFVWKYKN